MRFCIRVRWRQVANNNKSRVTLQFNEMDFRHRRALEILRKRPRSMSEIVVNALLHYTSCPEAANEFGRDWVVGIVKDVLKEMAANGELQLGNHAAPAPQEPAPGLDADDLSELGGMMDMFRTKG